MSIYDVVFYGVYFHYKYEFSGLNFFANKSDIVINPSFENLFFTAYVLKEYRGKKDVLCLNFGNGDVSYETLYEPGAFFENDVWQDTEYREAPTKFLKLYNELK